MKKLLFAGALGAFLAYLFDPQTGASRRSRLFGQLMGTFRSTANRAQNTASYATSAVQGKVQAVSQPPDNPNPDDVTLKDRVQSEIFGDTETGRENINVNVAHGVVVLRGEQPTPQAIDDLIARVKAVPGVKDVISYLHLPNTPAPNKEQAIRAG